MQALKSHDRNIDNSESSDTSGDDELGVSDHSKSDKGDEDSSSGDSLDDGADIPPNHIQFHPQGK